MWGLLFSSAQGGAWLLSIGQPKQVWVLVYWPTPCSFCHNTPWGGTFTAPKANQLVWYEHVCPLLLRLVVISLDANLTGFHHL
jgi:hypothetical protein